MADGTLSCPYPRQSPPSHDRSQPAPATRAATSRNAGMPVIQPSPVHLDYAPHEPAAVPVMCELVRCRRYSWREP